MTVEAAFVIPVFLFCILNLLWSFQMVETQSRVLAASRQVGNEIAVLAYEGKYLPKESSGTVFSEILSETYIRGKIIKELGTDYINKSCIKNQSSGIWLFGSQILEKNDLLFIKVNYFIRPFVAIPDFIPLGSCVRYFGRAWTGWDPTGDVMGLDTSEKMVFITKTGTVYHQNRGCSYLNPSIQSVTRGQLVGMQNMDGNAYRACTCVSSGVLGQVYITNYGDCFHENASCPGLKRTIYTVPISQVGSKLPCKKCGLGM